MNKDERNTPVCRDCADFGPICPNSGEPCDSAATPAAPGEVKRVYADLCIPGAPYLAAMNQGRPTGDQLRQIAQSARTSASDPASPSELVLAGWHAALSNPAPVAAPAPASEAVAWNIPDQCPHMIVFDDADVSPLTFAGSSARPAALEAFKRASLQWNAHLFVRIAHNSRDDAYPDATPGDSADAPVQQAGELSESERAELERLRGLINTPHTDDFFTAINLEAAHQIERFGDKHDQGKTPTDWLFLIGYLAGKAATSFIRGDADKGKHHIVSSGAVLLNWWRHATGVHTEFRPGRGD